MWIMKVVHLCVSNFYVDGYGYQENELIRQHVRDGHDVKVIASLETINANGKLHYTNPGTYVGSEGALITRIPYVRWLPHLLARKLRIHAGIYQKLEKIKPDVIIFHSLCGWELLTVARYKRNHPDVIFNADSHEDWNNSARSFLSRELLHKRYYGPILRNALTQIDRIFCISLEVMDFVADVYRVPRHLLEFFPLAGYPVPPDQYRIVRTKTRAMLGLDDHHVAFIQTGKLSRRKKLVESLHAFMDMPDEKLRFIIAGVMDEDVRKEVEPLIASDPRVCFLGWVSIEELNKLLIASDIYLQPGTQSVTLQHALCSHCAIIIDDVKSHIPYMKNNGWLIKADMGVKEIFYDVSRRASDLPVMQDASYLIAQEMLDYSVLANRILS
jgi:hypothetical protein